MEWYAQDEREGGGRDGGVRRRQQRRVDVAPLEREEERGDRVNERREPRRLRGDGGAGKGGERQLELSYCSVERALRGYGPAAHARGGYRRGG